MNDNPKRNAVTFGFNIMLFVYLIYASFVSFMFDPEWERPIPMDDFFEIAPATVAFATFALGFTLLGVGALAIKGFWNRLVASLFSTRDINYQESLSIILLICIIRHIQA